MANKDFETKVLEQFRLMHDKFDQIDKRFDGVDRRLDGIDKRFDGMDKKMDQGFDRLENLIIDNTDELKQEIRLQGAYLNQAFDRISYIQSATTLDKMKKKK